MKYFKPIFCGIFVLNCATLTLTRNLHAVEFSEYDSAEELEPQKRRTSLNDSRNERGELIKSSQETVTPPHSIFSTATFGQEIYGILEYFSCGCLGRSKLDEALPLPRPLPHETLRKKKKD